MCVDDNKKKNSIDHVIPSSFYLPRGDVNLLFSLTFGAEVALRMRRILFCNYVAIEHLWESSTCRHKSVSQILLAKICSKRNRGLLVISLPLYKKKTRHFKLGDI